METYDSPKTVKVRARGQLTIPRELRKQLELDRDSIRSILRVGKTLIIAPAPSKRVALARQVEAAMKSEGITLDDLLADLRAQRQRYLREAYPESERKKT